MAGLSARNAYGVAIVSGALLWFATAAASGRREAWDSSLYWTVAYPVAIVVSGILGFLSPDRPWRWALALMLAQAVALTLSASSFGLLPLGLIMFAILALPGMAVAVVAAGLRTRRGSGPV